MQRLPCPPHAAHRSRTLAHVAGRAGAAVLMAALAALSACKGDADVPIATADAASTSTAPQKPAVADVPPPPQIQSVATPSAMAAAPLNAASAAALTSMRSQLESLLVGAASCSQDSECKTVSTGGKACGGPTAYRAYSDKGPGADRIPDLAASERQLSLDDARASHRVSPCFMLADPGGHCEAGKCQTGPAASVK